MSRWLKRWPRVPGLYWLATPTAGGGWDIRLAEVDHYYKGSSELRYYLRDGHITLNRVSEGANLVRWWSSPVVRPPAPRET